MKPRELKKQRIFKPITLCDTEDSPPFGSSVIFPEVKKDQRDNPTLLMAYS